MSDYDIVINSAKNLNKDMMDIKSLGLGSYQDTATYRILNHLFGGSLPPGAKENVLNQARSLNSNLLSLPQPPNTGSTIKDFLLNALQTAPNALGAKIPPAAIVGPKISLSGSSPPFNRRPMEELGFSPAENANRYNPKVNDVLSFLSKENIPIENVKDTSGGTSYIKANNPHAPKDNITIRIPNDAHIGTRGYRYNPGDLFDLGTQPVKGGGQKPNYTQNASGEKYGENPQALEDAIKYRFSKDLVPPGREPKSRTEKSIIEEQKEPHINDMIDKYFGEMEKPQLTTKEMKSQSRFASDPIPYAGGRLISANTPYSEARNPFSMNNFLDNHLKTDAGKYEFAQMKQKAEKMGINTEGKNWFDIFKEMNPDLFGK